MSKIYSKSTGFSLIELLVATTIMAILTMIVVVSFRQANRSARDARRKADLQEIRGILENYRLETGTYPESVSESGSYEVSSDGTFMENVPTSYMSKQYADPVNDVTYFYRYQVRNLPGCTYELSVLLESGNGQSCSACGYTDANYYCITD